MNRALLLTYGRPVLWRGAGDPVPAAAPSPTETATSPVVASATPTVVLVHVEGLSANPNDPTYEELRSAFTASRVAGSNDAGRGNWIGPGPRVTRRDFSAPISYAVSAASVYSWPATGGTTPALIAELNANLARSMRAINTLSTDGWHITIVPFNTTVNGALSWWSSGQAAITRTRDSSNVLLPTVGEAHENPTGPTTEATTPPSGNPFDGLATAAKWGVGLAVAGTAGYFAIQLYNASKQSRSDK
jgi:hypothetical protein